MDRSWFNNEFIEACLSRHIEPVIDGNGKLTLICARVPSQEEQAKIQGLIPQGQEVSWKEGVRQYTYACLKYALQTAGAYAVRLTNLPGHRLRIEVRTSEDNPNMVPEFWAILACLLRKDPYINGYEIILNDVRVWDSMSETPDSVPDIPGCGLEDGYKLGEQLKKRIASELDQIKDKIMDMLTSDTPSKEKVVPAVKQQQASFSDDRFGYEREYLPPDVATDVKILLESTGSVEEFLKRI